MSTWWDRLKKLRCMVPRVGLPRVTTIRTIRTSFRTTFETMRLTSRRHSDELDYSVFPHPRDKSVLDKHATSGKIKKPKGGWQERDLDYDSDNEMSDDEEGEGVPPPVRRPPPVPPRKRRRIRAFSFVGLKALSRLGSQIASRFEGPSASRQVSRVEFEGSADNDADIERQPFQPKHKKGKKEGGESASGQGGVNPKGFKPAQGQNLYARNQMNAYRGVSAKQTYKRPAQPKKGSSSRAVGYKPQQKHGSILEEVERFPGPVKEVMKSNSNVAGKRESWLSSKKKKEPESQGSFDGTKKFGANHKSKNVSGLSLRMDREKDDGESTTYRASRRAAAAKRNTAMSTASSIVSSRPISKREEANRTGSLPSVLAGSIRSNSQMSQQTTQTQSPTKYTRQNSGTSQTSVKSSRPTLRVGGEKVDSELNSDQDITELRKSKFETLRSRFGANGGTAGSSSSLKASQKPYGSYRSNSYQTKSDKTATKVVPPSSPSVSQKPKSTKKISEITKKFHATNGIVRSGREKKLRESIRGIANLASFWAQQAEASNQKQAANPFSSQFKGGKETLKGAVFDSKSELRAQQAQEWTTKEINKLVEIIKEFGEFNQSSNTTNITFGELFTIYEQVSDTLVFMLIKAKKRQLIDYEAREMLLQGRDDKVVICAFH